MAGLNIIEVQADPAHRRPIKQLLRNIPESFGPILWPQAMPDDPGSSTTLRPTFLELENTKSIHLQVEFQFLFPDPWIQEQSDYYLEGHGSMGVVLRSERQLAANTVTFHHTVKNFHVMNEDTGRIPFKDAGPWSWTLWRVPVATQVPDISVISTINTCLELYFHPGEPGSDDDIFDDGYPAELLRLYIPPYNEIYGHGQNLDLAVSAYVVEQTWKYGGTCPTWLGHDQWMGYDSILGAPFFVEGHKGGDFQLSAWLGRSMQWCNCYDLAAIVQIACRLFGSSQGQEAFPSQWVYGKKFGYIPLGPLFGWDYDFSRNCNNPFWWPNQHVINLPRDDTARNPFGNHAWIEIIQSGMQTGPVLDACHSVNTNNALAGLSKGSQSRQQYHNEATDEGVQPGYEHPPQNKVYASEYFLSSAIRKIPGAETMLAPMGVTAVA